MKKTSDIKRNKSYMSCEYSNICDRIESLPIFCERFDIIKKIKSCSKRAIYNVIDKKNNQNSIVKFIIKHNISEHSTALLYYIKQINNQYIYKITEIGEAGGFLIIISKYIEGQLFDEFTKTATNESIIKVIKGIIQGLNILHSHNIQHVDIKPSNIIVSNKFIPTIIDFDLSKVIKNDFIEDSIISGTFPYIPRETFEEKKYYLKSDIWSLGVTIIRSLYIDNFKPNSQQSICIIESPIRQNPKNIISIPLKQSLIPIKIPRKNIISYQIPNSLQELKSNLPPLSPLLPQINNKINTINSINSINTINSINSIYDYYKNNKKFYEKYSKFDIYILKDKLGKKFCDILKTMVNININERPTTKMLIEMLKDI
jgi:serine/threonine protein kinase